MRAGFMTSLLTGALIALSPVSASADTALFLLNEDYDHGQDLQELRPLVRLGRPLQRSGFEILSTENSGHGELYATFARFYQQNTDRVLIVASGHFAQSQSQTWFLGTGAERPSAAIVGDRALSVDALMDAAADLAPGRAVILLAIENRTIRLGRGLTLGIADLDPPPGVTVIVGPSRQLAELTRQVLLSPGGNLTAALAEAQGVEAYGFISPLVPFTEGEVTGDYRPRDPEPPILPAQPSSNEAALWAAADELNSVGAYNAYLQQYPNGFFANEARSRIAGIQNDPAIRAEAEENGLGLTRQDRRGVQTHLTNLGYNTNGIDGIFGAGTRAAIARWQEANGAEPTGFLNGRQINLLTRQGRARAAEIAAEEERAREEAERADRAYWQVTGQGASEAGLRAYLQRFPEGIYADEANRRLAALTPQDEFAALGLSQQQRQRLLDRENALNLPPVTRSLIEQRLQALGLDPGRVDGQFNRRTRNAILQYQRARGLDGTGFLNQPTVVRLMAETFLGR